MRYYYMKEYYICSNCFSKGAFPSDLSSQDFNCIEGPIDWVGGIPDIWPDEKKLLLLETLEKEHDWAKVAAAVGETVEACQMQFISQSTIIHPDRKSFLNSLSKTFNPVIELVQLISRAVHPGLGASAAHAALNFLAQSESNIKEATVMASAVAFDSAVKAGKAQLDGDIQMLESGSRELIRLCQTRIRLKLGHLKAMQNLLKMPEQERWQLAKLFRDNF